VAALWDKAIFFYYGNATINFRFESGVAYDTFAPNIEYKEDT
jgi:hypothetical protein